MIEDAKGDINLSSTALIVLQKGSENYLLKTLKEARKCAAEAKRIKITPKDIKLARRIQGAHSSQPIKIAHYVFEAAGGSDNKKAPVIFLHGLLNSKEVWDTIPQRVAELTKRKVFTYDARNHGESEHTRNSSFNNNLQDLYSFMDRMDIQDSILVGHNLGGLTTISAALQEPKKVKKAFIVEMHLNKIQQELVDRSFTIMETWTNEIRRVPKDTHDDDITRISVSLMYENLPEEMKLQSEKETYQKSKFIYKRKPDGSFRNMLYTEAISESLKLYEKSPIIHNGKYEGAAFFLYGSNSLLNVGYEEANIKKHFPLAEMIEFENASHYLFVDFPDKFVDTLVQRMK